ncbi:hypothetical protein CHS0354_038629 [Potamilus streckersoni]|uniref:Ig-like domain-containing protein n=1 Tax=Potamilus streckersoni TaxID=2493646 RepID=A0AAE0TG64_9BIVA|nr:hypothetical protein CHS0354_038629 [Potamilus streckersoni]
MEVVSATIFNSYGNITAELAALDCNVLDVSSTYCSLFLRDEEWILSLTLFNVTEKQNGNYTLQLFQGLEEKDVRSKTLVVIGKPIIMEVGTPVLHQPFQLACNTPHRLKCFTFRWKINDTWIAPSNNANAHHVSSLSITDNFSQVSCHVCLNETRSGYVSETLDRALCSIESDIYIIEVTYGPDNVSLSVKESHFYLKKHEPFTIGCFANCSPQCTFRWKGHDSTEGEKLVITSFEPRMAGQYACYVTNQRTNVTINSDFIFLHHEKVTLLARENEDPQSTQYLMWAVIVSVFLLLVGLLILIMHWHKATNSRELCQPCVGQAHSAVSREKPRGPHRPLPIPAVQENVSRINWRLYYRKGQRSSVSLENLADQTISFRNQRRENVPLTSFFRSPNTIERIINNRDRTDDSVNRTCGSELYSLLCCVEESATRNRPLTMVAKVKRDHEFANDEQITAQNFETKKNPIQEDFAHIFQENPYNTIDDDTLTIYSHCGIDRVTEKTSHETSMKTEHVSYDYAHSTEICQAETVDVHATAETYITPISDFSHPFTICQDEEAVMLKTDHTYLALIDDLANPNEICRVEETNMNETNQPI